MTHNQIVARLGELAHIRAYHYGMLKGTAGVRREVHRSAIDLCVVESSILSRMRTQGVDSEEDRIMAMCEAYDAAMGDRDEYPVRYFSL